MGHSEQRERKTRAFEESVMRITEHIVNDWERDPKSATGIFGLSDGEYTPAMAAYFKAFARLVIEKNVRAFFRKKRVVSVPEGEEKDMLGYMSAHRGDYGFNLNGISHDIVHHLIALARSPSKRRTVSLTPGFQRADTIVHDTVAVTSRGVFLDRDEILVAQFGSTMASQHRAPGNTAYTDAGKSDSVQKRIWKRVQFFYEGDYSPTRSTFFTLARSLSDRFFWRLMTEIAENNGKDPLVLYKIFVREAEEFLSTFAPHVPKPIL